MFKKHRPASLNKLPNDVGYNQLDTNKQTFICDTGGVTEAAAMTEGLNGGILITERMHMSMWPPCKQKMEKKTISTKKKK